MTSIRKHKDEGDIRKKTPEDELCFLILYSMLRSLQWMKVLHLGSLQNPSAMDEGVAPWFITKPLCNG